MVVSYLPVECLISGLCALEFWIYRPIFVVKLGWDFLGALYNGKHTDVERQFKTDFLCEELCKLYTGLEFTVNGQKYFIQARLILHILDTKAAEPVFGFQSAANSKFGCPLCRGVTGLYNGKKCVLYGHRNYLPQLHWLRFFGQTGYCCPNGFYNYKNKINGKLKKCFGIKKKVLRVFRRPSLLQNAEINYSRLRKAKSARIPASRMQK